MHCGFVCLVQKDQLGVTYTMNHNHNERSLQKKMKFAIYIYWIIMNHNHDESLQNKICYTYTESPWNIIITYYNHIESWPILLWLIVCIIEALSNVIHFMPLKQFTGHKYMNMVSFLKWPVPVKSRHPNTEFQHIVKLWINYSDLIMSVMASQITGISIDCSTVCSGADRRKLQSSASLDFVRGIHRSGIHRWPVDSPHKGLVMRKMFPFDDIIMYNYKYHMHIGLQ